jgi:dTDP-4-dehydrorhamnose 3,5-epimerase
VLRGLHFQKQYPQGKLVRAIRGAVFDVAVDLRANSKTYGKWFGVELTAENKKQFYISEGFAHGFVTLEDDTEFQYKCTDYYAPEFDAGIIWNDKTVLRNGFRGESRDGKRGRYACNRCAYIALCDGADGTLAGGNGNL